MATNNLYARIRTITLLCVVLGLSFEVRGQFSVVEQPILSCPTGSMLAFSKTIEANNGRDLSGERVYIRRSDSVDRRVWQVPALPVVLAANSDELNTKHGIGFIVPQLNRGRYQAWYGTPEPTQAAESLTFDALPHLLVENAIERGQPFSEVVVQVRIFSP